MSSQEFLFYALGIGFLVLVGYSCYLLYNLTQAVKTLKSVIEDAEDITKDVSKLKNTIKLGLFNLLSSLIKKGR
jgi:hypothetical protein